MRLSQLDNAHIFFYRNLLVALSERYWERLWHQLPQMLEQSTGLLPETYCLAADGIQGPYYSFCKPSDAITFIFITS